MNNRWGKAASGNIRNGSDPSQGRGRLYFPPIAINYSLVMFHMKCNIVASGDDQYRYTYFPWSQPDHITQEEGS